MIAVQDVLDARQEQLTHATNGAPRAELVDEINKLKAYLEEARSHVRFEDRAKRDRSSVKNAIKRAIKVIAEHDPGLARHLRNSIRTGYSCSYRPEKPVAWSL
jgi:non-specific serine/threonine protein kinase